MCLLGTNLLMSTAFHPETDGAMECANKTMNSILQGVIQPDQTNWEEKLPMVEFAINSAQSSMTGFSPFELNYGYIPSLRKILPTIPSEFHPGVRAYAECTHSNLIEAHDSIIAARVDQTYHANSRRRKEHSYQIGDKVWLSTENLTMLKGQVKKLLPKFIGPFRITQVDLKTSNYCLELPNETILRWIHNNFHSSHLRKYIPNNDEKFPLRDAGYVYDYGEPEDTEWFVNEITSHQWKGKAILFLVRWSTGESTWEPYD